MSFLPAGALVALLPLHQIETGSPPALHYSDLADTKLTPQGDWSEPNDPSEVAWRVQIIGIADPKVDVIIDDDICVASLIDVLKILQSVDQPGEDWFPHNLQ